MTTQTPVPSLLHERLPHRPRPSVVRRFWVSPWGVGAFGFLLVLACLMSLEKATHSDLLPLALGVVAGCLLFGAALKAAPGPVEEYVELGKVEWFE